MDKEGGFINKPPILDGTKYDYWKTRMIVFLKSIDNKSWKVVVKGWSPLEVKDKDGNIVLKKEEEQDAKDHEATLRNSKSLNDMFNGVDMNIFRSIRNFTVAKDAWEILKTAHK